MPRQKRRFGPRKRSQSAPATLVSSRRPNKRKQWADNDMVEAIKAVENGMSLERAAEMYGVPHYVIVFIPYSGFFSFG